MRQFIVVAVFLINFCGVRAENKLAATTSPKKVVTDLYSAHRGKADPAVRPQLRGRHMPSSFRP
jgi:hypothetical protein